MVNRKVFKETYQLFDQDVIIEIIDIFIDEYPEKLRKLGQDITARDFKALRFTAHNLKGVVANFSAPAPLEIIKEFEKVASHLYENEGENFDEANLNARLAEISSSVIRTAEDLKQIKKEILNGDFVIGPVG